MKTNIAKGIALVVAGFGAGMLVANLPHATAADVADSVDLSQKHFLVSIDEIQQNFVFAEEFAGRYSKTLTLSDGTTREIELVPTIHNGMQVVQFKDTGGYTYMDLNGTTTNGKLMVHILDRDAMYAQLAREGRPVVGR